MPDRPQSSPRRGRLKCRWHRYRRRFRPRLRERHFAEERARPGPQDLDGEQRLDEQTGSSNTRYSKRYATRRILLLIDARPLIWSLEPEQSLLEAFHS